MPSASDRTTRSGPRSVVSAKRTRTVRACRRRKRSWVAFRIVGRPLDVGQRQIVYAQLEEVRPRHERGLRSKRRPRQGIRYTLLTARFRARHVSPSGTVPPVTGALSGHDGHRCLPDYLFVRVVVSMSHSVAGSVTWPPRVVVRKVLSNGCVVLGRHWRNIGKTLASPPAASGCARRVAHLAIGGFRWR